MLGVRRHAVAARPRCAISSCRSTRTRIRSLPQYSGARVTLLRCAAVRLRAARGASGAAALLRSDVRPALVRRLDAARARGATTRIGSSRTILDGAGAAAAGSGGAGSSTSARTPDGSCTRPGRRVGRRRPRAQPKTAAYRGAASRRAASTRATSTPGHDRVRRYDAVTLTDVLEHIPDPGPLLSARPRSLAPGGWLAIKVPNGPAQRVKETCARGCGPAIAARSPTIWFTSIIFSPSSLRRRSSATGFGDVASWSGAPELPAGSGRLHAHRPTGAALALSRRRAILPGGAYTPLAFNLQAYGRRSRGLRHVSDARAQRRHSDLQQRSGAAASDRRLARVRRQIGVEIVVVEDGCRDGTRGLPRAGRGDALGHAAPAMDAPGRRARAAVHESRHRARARALLIAAWQDDMFLRAGLARAGTDRGDFAAYPDLGMLALSRGLNCHPGATIRSTRWEDLIDWRRLQSTIGPAPGTGSACRRSTP